MLAGTDAGAGHPVRGEPCQLSHQPGQPPKMTQGWAAPAKQKDELVRASTPTPSRTWCCIPARTPGAGDDFRYRLASPRRSTASTTRRPECADTATCLEIGGWQAAMLGRNLEQLAPYHRPGGRQDAAPASAWIRATPPATTHPHRRGYAGFMAEVDR